MSLNETVHHLNVLLVSITKDLSKVGRGNKAAAQRVRVGTIRLERIAKQFRKESVASEKGRRPKKKSAFKGAGKKRKKKKA
jgi:hypothetical protein